MSCLPLAGLAEERMTLMRDFLSSLHLLGISLYLKQQRETEMIIAEHFITFYLKPEVLFRVSPIKSLSKHTVTFKERMRVELFAGAMYSTPDVKFWS